MSLELGNENEWACLREDVTALSHHLEAIIQLTVNGERWENKSGWRD